MDLNKKALAVLAAVTLGTAGTALATSADSFSDVPKDPLVLGPWITWQKKASSKAWATAPLKAATA